MIISHFLVGRSVATVQWCGGGAFTYGLNAELYKLKHVQTQGSLIRIHSNPPIHSKPATYKCLQEAKLVERRRGKSQHGVGHMQAFHQNLWLYRVWTSPNSPFKLIYVPAFQPHDDTFNFEQITLWNHLNFCLNLLTFIRDRLSGRNGIFAQYLGIIFQLTYLQLTRFLENYSLLVGKLAEFSAASSGFLLD